MTKDELLLKATEAAQAISNLQFGLGYYAAQLIDLGMTSRALADTININEKTLSEYTNVYRYYDVFPVGDSDIQERIDDLRENPLLTYSHWWDARKLKRLHPGDSLAQVARSVTFLEHVVDNAIKVTPARLEIDALLKGVPFVPMSIAWDSAEDEFTDFTDVLEMFNDYLRQPERYRIKVYELGNGD